MISQLYCILSEPHVFPITQSIIRCMLHRLEIYKQMQLTLYHINLNTYSTEMV